MFVFPFLILIIVLIGILLFILHIKNSYPENSKLPLWKKLVFHFKAWNIFRYDLQQKSDNKSDLTHTPKMDFWRAFKQLRSMFTFILFLCIPMTLPLFFGGFLIPFEAAVDTVEGSGIVEQIVEPSRNIPWMVVQFPSDEISERSTIKGADITINGQTYLILTAEKINIGDHVVFEYLPYSKAILLLTVN